MAREQRRELQRRVCAAEVATRSPRSSSSDRFIASGSSSPRAVPRRGRVEVGRAAPTSRTRIATSPPFRHVSGPRTETSRPRRHAQGPAAVSAAARRSAGSRVRRRSPRASTRIRVSASLSRSSARRRREATGATSRADSRRGTARYRRAKSQLAAARALAACGAALQVLETVAAREDRRRCAAHSARRDVGEIAGRRIDDVDVAPREPAPHERARPHAGSRTRVNGRRRGAARAARCRPPRRRGPAARARAASASVHARRAGPRRELVVHGEQDAQRLRRAAAAVIRSAARSGSRMSSALERRRSRGGARA